MEEHYGAARVAYRHQDPPEMEEEPPTKMDIGEEMKEVRKEIKDLSEAVKDLRAMLSLQNSVAVTKGPLASWWTRIWGK